MLTPTELADVKTTIAAAIANCEWAIRRAEQAGWDTIGGFTVAHLQTKLVELKADQQRLNEHGSFLAPKGHN